MRLTDWKQTGKTRKGRQTNTVKIKFNLKNQIVESQSTQVRQRYMKCDTQILYGTSGPIVREDGRSRASNTCALQGYVQMCMRSTLCSGDRHTHNRDTNKELITNKQTWDPTLFQQSSCHCRMTAAMRSHQILGNKVICD